MMIDLVAVEVADGRALNLSFSDGSFARWSAERLIERDTMLTRPLADPAFLARAFIDGGALAWPNGFELSPTALHQRLAAEGRLQRTAA